MNDRADPSSSDRTPEPGATRVAVITGTRLCVQCGFDLCGQTVLRESTYGLLIARCPECGMVAPLQEYPPLGNWSRRWAVTLLVLWIALILCFGLLTAMIPSASISTWSWQCSTSLARHIGEAWYPVLIDAIESARADDGSADDLSPGMLSLAQQYIGWLDTPNSGYNNDTIRQWAEQGALQVDEDWWNANRATILASAPGASWTWVRSKLLIDWGFRALATAVLGAFWAALFLHLRMRARILVGLLMLAASVVLSIANSSSMYGLQYGWAGQYWWAGSPNQTNGFLAAQRELWPQIATVAIAAFAVPFMLGLIFGRPFIRLLARLVLPPRLCHALAPLWFCDGKTPPRVTPPPVEPPSRVGRMPVTNAPDAGISTP